jgi:predicted Zn-dependent peptidase
MGFTKVGDSDYLFVLPNGLRVVFTQTHKSSIVYCAFVVGVGSRYESAENNGIAHFIEHSLFKGTKKRKAYHILNRIESVGGELNAFTTRERSCYYSIALRSYFDRSIELLTDLVFHPVFPEAEVEKEKLVIAEEIEMYEDSPEESIYDDFNLHSFPGSSLGFNILGTKESISRFNRQKVLDFWKRFYTTENVVVSIVGSMQPERVERMINKYLLDLKTTNTQKPLREQASYTHFNFEFEKTFQQEHCIVGNKAYSIYDEKKYPLFLLNNVLGGDWMSSRLNLSVREKHAYAYHVTSGYNAYADIGVFSVQLGTDEKHLEKSLDLVEKEFARLREKTLSPIQLNRAKNKCKVNWL